MAPNEVEKPAIENVEYVEDHIDGSEQRSKTTARLVCFALVVAFCPLLATFDYSFAGFVLATPSFNNTFGNECLPRALCQMSATQQSLIAIASLFQALGGGLAGAAGGKLGRRAVLTIGGAISISGAVVMLVLQGNFVAFMAAKCLSGVGLGALIAVGIAYGVECIRADKRPVLLSMYGIANAFGVFIGACILVGSSKLAPATNDWQWKTLVAVQIPAGLALMALVWCFPESPRWLLIQHRPDEARRSFATYFNKEPDSPMIMDLVNIVEHHLNQEESQRESSSWTEMYRGINRRRTILSGFIMTMLALSGVQFILTYGTVFLVQSGISNVFTTNVAISACNLAGSLLSPVSLEFMGCRGSLLWSSTAMALCMLVFAAVSSGLGAASEVARTVLVVFVCLWTFCFGAGLGGGAWLASSEMHSLRLRTYGQASSATVYQLWSFAATFWTPYMLRPEYGNMGTNVGYFYFGLTAVMFIITFLWVPETAKLSLEQIDDYFALGRPAWRTSVQRNKEVGI